VGLLEVDIALTRFLDDGLISSTTKQQQAFVELADMEDHDLWHLISGRQDATIPRFPHRGDAT
jgi:antitoxin CptB